MHLDYSSVYDNKLTLLKQKQKVEFLKHLALNIYMFVVGVLYVLQASLIKSNSFSYYLISSSVLECDWESTYCLRQVVLSLQRRGCQTEIRKGNHLSNLRPGRFCIHVKQLTTNVLYEHVEKLPLFSLRLHFRPATISVSTLCHCSRC